jgi:hypothetical protein
MFDIFYLGDNPSLQERFPFAKQVSDLSEVRPRTIMYWLVEPNITITDWDVFEVRPEPYDQSYEHVYKWNSANYGGVRLLPRGESQGRKEVNRVVCVKTYDVLRQSDPGDYFDCHPWVQTTQGYVMTRSITHLTYTSFYIILVITNHSRSSSTERILVIIDIDIW